MKEILLSIFSFVASLSFVIIFIAFGWYIVWRVFLSRFKLVRELIGSMEASSSDETKGVQQTPELSSPVANGVRTRSGRNTKRVRIE